MGALHDRVADLGTALGAQLGRAAARAVLRRTVTSVAAQATDEPGFFAGLRKAGVMVRLRFGKTGPGQVTEVFRYAPWLCRAGWVGVLVRRRAAG